MIKEKRINVGLAGIEPTAIIKEVGRTSALAAQAELIDNGFDSGSLTVEIITEKSINPAWAIYLDSGSGMNFSALEAFFRFGRTLWQTSRHKGTNGKGSKYILAHVGKMLVRTRPVIDGPVYSFELTEDSWLKMILSGQAVMVNQSQAGDHESDSLDTTFTMIQVWPRKEKKKFFSESYLIENLAGLISPRYTENIFVNGKILLERELLNRFEYRLNDPVLGEIDVDLYQPGQVKMRAGLRVDRLMIGTIGPVMDFSEFVANLPEDCRSVPMVFLDRSVCGLIEVENFNQWREGASKQFLDELYHSREANHFYLFLTSVLAPEVAKRFGLASASAEDRERANLLALKNEVERAFGPEQRKMNEETKRKRPDFHVSPLSTVVIPGEQIEFFAYGAAGDVFSWDVSMVPGASLDKKEGSRVCLLVEPQAKYSSVDKYKIIVTSKKYEQTRTIYIKIAEIKTMAIIPGTGPHFLNTRGIFRAVNVPALTHTLQWRVEPDDAGVFSRNRGFEGIEFTPKKVGKCRIWAVDPSNGNISAYSDRYVRKAESSMVEPEEDSVRLKIKDGEEVVVFRVRLYFSPTSQLTIFDPSNEKEPRVAINNQHPMYRAKLKESGGSWRLFVLMTIVQRYVDWKYEGSERQDRLGELLAAFVAKK